MFKENRIKKMGWREIEMKNKEWKKKKKNDEKKEKKPKKK